MIRSRARMDVTDSDRLQVRWRAISESGEASGTVDAETAGQAAEIIWQVVNDGTPYTEVSISDTATADAFRELAGDTP